MDFPSHLHEVNPPNLLPLALLTNTKVLLAESHFLWNISALSESTIALYNKFKEIFLYLFWHIFAV